MFVTRQFGMRASVEKAHFMGIFLVCRRDVLGDSFTKHPESLAWLPSGVGHHPSISSMAYIVILGVRPFTASQNQLEDGSQVGLVLRKPRSSVGTGILSSGADVFRRLSSIAGQAPSRIVIQ